MLIGSANQFFDLEYNLTNCKLSIMNFLLLNSRYRRRTMYFVSSILSILSLIAFGTMGYIMATWELDKAVETALKWSSLGAACTLVFAVQVKNVALFSEVIGTRMRAHDLLPGVQVFIASLYLSSHLGPIQIAPKFCGLGTTQLIMHSII